ncbi:MAG: EAL domain-containing protein [Spirochaetales bacterium]|nr:EAL domain-containing protein [Spirochaetales bacterium]MCP5485129.1 EAL domain-containing protein [Spirochaetales bacterium]
MEEQASILVVDDDQSSRDLISYSLGRRGFDVDVVESGAAGLKYLETRRPDLILLDYLMPSPNGLETLHQIREKFSAAELPVIVITTVDEGLAVVEMLGAGANDFVSKPLEPPVLYARIRVQLELRRANLEIKRNEERFRHLAENAVDIIYRFSPIKGLEYVSPAVRTILGYEPEEFMRNPDMVIDRRLPGSAGIGDMVFSASPPFVTRWVRKNGDVIWVENRWSVDSGEDLHAEGVIRDITARIAYDDLTGLPNQTLFRDTLAHRMGDGGPAAFAVTLLSLDRFEIMNQSLGQGHGERVLSAAADRLRNAVARADSVARWGEFRFAVLLREVKDPLAALDRTEAIIRNLERPYIIGGRELYLTVSSGIYVGHPGAGDQLTEALRGAEAALLQAEAGGRSRTVIYEERMRESFRSRMEMESDLRRAIEENEFEIFFQPILHVATKRVQRLECLIRWKHALRGWVAPTDFVPLAEETELIHPLGDWIIRRACEGLARLRAAGQPELRAAINLSPLQFARRDLSQTLRMALESSGLKPDAIELEITESTLMGQGAEMLERMRELKSAGLTIAIDDFGTGYSSLAYLSRFPVDCLKIDRSFVGAMADAGRNAAIVRAIVALAHSLELEVVAEGVETRAQLDLLTELNCDYVQGFLIGKPCPERDLPALLNYSG